jgi:hypothetical protein
MNCGLCEKEAKWRINDQEGGIIRYCCDEHLVTLVAKLRVFVGSRVVKEQQHEHIETNAR